jgi:catalase
MNERKATGNRKQGQLEQYKVTDEGQALTTNQGVKVAEDEFSLKAGERGPTLMEDFHFREKMTHFDHERIPERIVHARGFAAHGEFELYESMKEYTKAGFLQDPSVKTPVFVRFSTVAGSRGSAETVRDARGFAVKFYTEEGNYDLVGNNIPVFLFKTRLNSRISCMRSSRSRTMRCRRRLLPMTRFGILSLTTKSPRTWSCGRCRTGRFRAASG